MRASTVLVGLAASCAASTTVALLVVGIWMIASAAPQGGPGLLTAEALQFFVAMGGFAALTTVVCATPLCLLLFLVHRPLLNLLKGSLVRYIVAGAAMGAFSVAVMWSVGFPPDPSDFDLAVFIACLAGPTASATFWFSTRYTHGPPRAHN